MCSSLQRIGLHDVCYTCKRNSCKYTQSKAAESRRIVECKQNLGLEDFVGRIELGGEERRLGNIRDQDVDLPVFDVCLDEIDEAVGNHFGVEIEVLSDHGGSAGLTKRMAVRLTIWTQREIGAHYGGMIGQVVSMIRYLKMEALPSRKS